MDADKRMRRILRRELDSSTKGRSDTINDVFDLIDLAAKRLKHIQRRIIGKTGLTPPQYFLLNLIWEEDGRKLKELAEISCCSAATITGVVDSLEKNGMVIREPNPEDRRSLLVKLTDQGRALKDSEFAKKDTFGHCCTGLSPEEFRELGKLLEKLNNSLILNNGK